MSDLWVCSRWNTEPKDEEKHKVIVIGPCYESLEKYDGYHYYFPVDEYVPCPAPEQWERVEVKLKWIAVPEMKAKGAFIGEAVNTGAEIMAGQMRFYYDGYRVVSLVVERRRT